MLFGTVDTTGAPIILNLDMICMVEPLRDSKETHLFHMTNGAWYGIHKVNMPDLVVVANKAHTEVLKK